MKNSDQNSTYLLNKYFSMISSLAYTVINYANKIILFC